MTFWQDRPTLVTGATGIVGSWVVKELLARGAAVIALVRDLDPGSELVRSGDVDRITLVRGELEDYRSVERAINEQDVETVLHLAAQPLVAAAHRSPMATFEANIRGTYHVLEACRVHRSLVGRVVVASSDKAYGTQPVLPYTEEMSLIGRAPYEVSKSCADLLAQSYFHTYGLPVAIARCGNIYGGGDLNWSRIVPGTIRALLGEQAPVVRSDGTFVRDYIYVKDVAAAYLRTAEAVDDGDAAGEAFNFSTEEPLGVLELVSRIGERMGRPDVRPRVLDHAEGEIHDQHLSAGKAHRQLSWTPEWSLERGLDETIDWYRGYLAA